LVAGAAGTFQGFSTPACTAGEGWSGSGAPDDPHRLTFDGDNSWVDFGAILSTPTFTLSIWVRLLGPGNAVNTAGDGVTIAPFFGKGSAETDSNPRLDVGYAFGVQADLRVAMDYEAAVDSDSRHLVGSGTLTLSQWAHVAVTHDASTSSIYLRGMLDAERASPDPPSGAEDARVGLGALIDPDATSGGDLHGDVAVVRVYDRALSAQEIHDNCRAQAARFAGASCDG
jgi:hypothetical protein